MSRRVSGESPFQKISRYLIYAIALIILIYCGTAAYHFGLEIFSADGVEEKPGKNLTIEVAEGTTIQGLGDELVKYGIIKNSKVFYVQSIIFEIKNVKAGTYTFNTSQSGEDILDTVSAGPKEDQTDEKETQ